jgi:hypothetical protein
MTSEQIEILKKIEVGIKDTMTDYTCKPNPPNTLNEITQRAMAVPDRFDPEELLPKTDGAFMLNFRAVTVGTLSVTFSGAWTEHMNLPEFIVHVAVCTSRTDKFNPVTDIVQPKTQTKMKPYQERVVVEKTELDTKIKLLSTFLEDAAKVEAVAMEERHRMTVQLYAMRSYSDALKQRIENFQAQSAQTGS